jgi:hypothetical protein
VAYAHVAFYPLAFAIWTAVGNRVRHFSQNDRRNGRAVKVDHARNAAHN